MIALTSGSRIISCRSCALCRCVPAKSPGYVAVIFLPILTLSPCAEVKEEKIIDLRYYHTIKEVKNGEGPHPIKTSKGWLHLAHGVRGCAAGLRYVLYMYMTSLEDPTKVIAAPAGHLMGPIGEERIGDVSNVLFSNGWIADEDGKVFIYYASSDTRMHVATSTIEQLVDYCMNTPADGFRSGTSVETLTVEHATHRPVMSV